MPSDHRSSPLVSAKYDQTTRTSANPPAKPTNTPVRRTPWFVVGDDGRLLIDMSISDISETVADWMRSREKFSRAPSGMARFGMLVRGETVQIANAAVARAHFSLDPLIDGSEPISPLQDRKA
jgi:hypothetical protein